MKKFSLKFYLIAMVCVMLIGGVVYGQDIIDGGKTIINNYYGETTVDQTSDGQISSEVSYGAVTAIGGICDGSEPTTQLCNVNAYELQLQTDLTIDDDLIIGDEINQGDYDIKISSGSFADATTTPVAVLNPFSATSTVRFMIYNSVGVATSTHSVFCATSSTAFGAITTSDLTIIGATSIATSSQYYIQSSGTAVTDWATGAITYDTNVNNLLVKPTEYIVCTAVAVPVAYNGSFTEVTNTYTGTYMIKWERFSP